MSEKGDEESSDGDRSGLAAAQAEKEAIYPDEGFVLAEIDMMKPPGEALTKLQTELKLTEISIPPTTVFTDHVVYDADGHDYGHQRLKELAVNADQQQIERIREKLRSGDNHAVRHALYGLTTIADEHPGRCLDSIPLLARKLQADEIDIQAMALDVLATLADTHPSEISPIAADVIALLDPETDARLYSDTVTVVDAIAEEHPGAVLDATPKLAALLQEDEPITNQTIVVLNRIADSHPDAVVPVLSELEEYIKSEATEGAGALAVLGTVAREYPNVAESTIPTAIDRLDTESNRLRANAAALLADLADIYPDQIRSTVPDAITLLNDDDRNARYNATSILARIAKEYPDDVEPAVDPLIETLEEDFAPARANACWALGYLEADEALETLKALVDSDPNTKVRDAAAAAITEIEK